MADLVVRRPLGKGHFGDDAWFEREGRPELSKRLFEQVALAEELADFLTLPAYDELLRIEAEDRGGRSA